MICCNYNDIEEAVKANKIAAVLSIEGGEACRETLCFKDALQTWCKEHLPDMESPQ